MNEYDDKQISRLCIVVLYSCHSVNLSAKLMLPFATSRPLDDDAKADTNGKNRRKKIAFAAICKRFPVTLPTRTLTRLHYLWTLSLSLMHYRRLHLNVCTTEIVCGDRLFIAQLILNYICSYFYTCDDLWQIVINGRAEFEAVRLNWTHRTEKCFLLEFIFFFLNIE